MKSRETLQPLPVLTIIKRSIAGETEDTVRKRTLREEARVRRILRNPNGISQADIDVYEFEMLEEAWRATKSLDAVYEELDRSDVLTPDETRKEVLGWAWEYARERKLPNLTLKVL